MNFNKSIISFRFSFVIDLPLEYNKGWYIFGKSECLLKLLQIVQLPKSFDRLMGKLPPHSWKFLLNLKRYGYSKCFDNKISNFSKNWHNRIVLRMAQVMKRGEMQKIFSILGPITILSVLRTIVLNVKVKKNEQLFSPCMVEKKFAPCKMYFIVLLVLWS